MNRSLDLPPVETDDINQEAELLRLQGKTPNKSLIWKRLARAEAIFDDEFEVSATGFWSEDPIPDPEVTEALVKWAMEQSEEIAGVILRFLDAPTDQAAKQTMKKLKSLGVKITPAVKQPVKSLSKVIIEMLQKRSHKLDDLYEVARLLQPSRRPEAAVRQILRRLLKAHIITIKDETVSHAYYN